MEETGCQLVVVNSAFTTKMCSCSKFVEKDLSVRVHDCSDSGLEIERDVNASGNIRKKAFNPLGLSGQDKTWPVGASVS